MEVNKDIINHVENDSVLIDDVVTKVMNEYTGKINEYIDSIKTFLEEGTESLSLDDMNRISLRVASYLFFMSDNVCKASIRNSIAEQVRNERYNQEYCSLTSGTIADRTAKASEAVKQEEVVNIIFDKVYRTMKLKYSALEKLADTIRKIQTVKVNEMQISMKIGV